MNVLISGGCKNGKSYYAQHCAKEQADASGKPLYYIATMIPHDEEDHTRIKRHVSEREGWGFETLECGRHITDILKDSSTDSSGVFLLDSVTALLSNEMFDDDSSYDDSAAQRVRDELVAFAKATGSTIFVSDNIFSDAQQYTGTVEAYRRGLAAADRALAAVCDRVVEITAGMEEIWK